MRFVAAVLACLTACTPGERTRTRDAQRPDTVRADSLRREALARLAALQRQMDSARAAAATAMADSLARLKPEAEVARAVARGDRRFLAFKDPQPTVPGISMDVWAYPGAPALKYLVRPGPALDRRGDAAAALTAYMQAYNRVMAAHIRRLPGRPASAT